MTQDVTAHSLATNATPVSVLVIGPAISPDTSELNSPACPRAVRRVTRPPHNSMVRLAVLYALRPVTYSSRF